MQTALAFGIAAKNVNGRPSFHRAASAYQIGNGRLPPPASTSTLTDQDGEKMATMPSMPAITAFSVDDSTLGSSSIALPVPQKVLRSTSTAAYDDHVPWQHAKRRTSVVDKKNPFIGYFQMKTNKPTTEFASLQSKGAAVRTSEDDVLLMNQNPMMPEMAAAISSSSSATTRTNGTSKANGLAPYYSSVLFTQQKKLAEWLGSQSSKFPSFFKRESSTRQPEPPSSPADNAPSSTLFPKLRSAAPSTSPSAAPLTIDTKATAVEKNELKTQFNGQSQSLVVQSVAASADSRFAQDFELLGALGQGGQGAVFKVRSRIDGCYYAIKKVSLPKTMRKDSVALQQALREVKSMAAMPPHGNVVRYHTSWIEEERVQPICVQDEGASNQSFRGSDVESSSTNSEASQAMNEDENDEFTSFSLHDHSFSLDATNTYTNASGGFDFDEPSKSMMTLSTTKTTKKLASDEANEASVSSSASEASEGEINLILYIQMELCSTTAKPTTQPEVTLSTFFDRLKDAASKKPPKSSAEQHETIHSNLTAWLRSSVEARSSSSEYMTKHVEGLRLFLGVVQGVQHMHACGVIHRDLKPDNIFIHGAEAKIGDFGLSKSIFAEPAHESPRGLRSQSTGSTSSTDSGNHTTALGTFTYASPEQLGYVNHRSNKTASRAKSAKYSIQSDIFALGVILLELCCPFSTMMERSQVLTAVRHGVVPQRALQQFPVEMALVLRMTAVDPAERPSTDEIIDTIRSLVATSHEQNVRTAICELQELQTKLSVAVHQLRDRTQASAHLESLIAELSEKVQNVGLALA